MNFIAMLLNRLPSIALILIAASCTISGDYFAKSWSVTHRQTFYLLALLGYMLSGFFYIPVLQKQGLVISSLLWSIVTIVGFLIIGFVFFQV
jgi:multidrug transporter EmrE-like cation transporter